MGVCVDRDGCVCVFGCASSERLSAPRVLPRGAAPHLRVQPRLLLLEDLQEPRGAERNQVFTRDLRPEEGRRSVCRVLVTLTVFQDPAAGVQDQEEGLGGPRRTRHPTGDLCVRVSPQAQDRWAIKRGREGEREGSKRGEEGRGRGKGKGERGGEGREKGMRERERDQHCQST